MNNFEINVLNMRFEKFLGCGKLKAIIGRQESVCKECRVMGIGNWIIGRIWDGVRFTYYDTPAETFDLYSFEVKRTAVDPPVQSRGMYYFNEMHGVEIYAMNKIDRNGAAGESSNGAVNNIDVKTFGYKQKIKLGRIFNFYSELAYQKGRYSSDEHRAHASHFELKTNTPFALSLEYNRASGDGDPADGRHETFDNLFPANYGKYGYMNYMSWQNMKEHSISISKSYRNDVDIKIGFHKFMLDSAKDSWYNGFLARMRSDPSGKSGTDIGREIDLIVTKKLPGNFNVEFGAAKFYSGDYIKHTQSADNSASDSVWTFFQISKKHSF